MPRVRLFGKVHRNTSLEAVANGLAFQVPTRGRSTYLTTEYHPGKGNAILPAFMRLRRPKIVVSRTRPKGMQAAATVTITTGKRTRKRHLFVPRGTLFGQK